MRKIKVTVTSEGRNQYGMIEFATPRLPKTAASYVFRSTNSPIDIVDYWFDTMIAYNSHEKETRILTECPISGYLMFTAKTECAWTFVEAPVYEAYQAYKLDKAFERDVLNVKEEKVKKTKTKNSRSKTKQKT